MTDKDQHELRLSLYNSGMNDKEISEKVGTTRPCIHAWRQIHNLTPNIERGGKLSKEKHDQRMELYKKGFGDALIAKICNISRDTVASWRAANGLKTNKKLRLNPQRKDWLDKPGNDQFNRKFLET